MMHRIKIFITYSDDRGWKVQRVGAPLDRSDPIDVAHYKDGISVMDEEKTSDETRIVWRIMSDRLRFRKKSDGPPVTFAQVSGVTYSTDRKNDKKAVTDVKNEVTSTSEGKYTLHCIWTKADGTEEYRPYDPSIRNFGEITF